MGLLAWRNLVSEQTESQPTRGAWGYWVVIALITSAVEWHSRLVQKLSQVICALSPITLTYEKRSMTLWAWFYLRRSSKDIELDVNIDSQTPAQLFFDEYRVGQVLTNLLSNAIRIYLQHFSITTDIAYTPMSMGRGKLERSAVFRIRACCWTRN